MVRWYHLIMSAYGFWLPNDPRGSWSEFVASWELLKFGGPTKVEGKRSYAQDSHDVDLRRNAKTALKYPLVRFNETQRGLVADGFGVAISESGYQIHACCIAFDHSHLIIRRHERAIERIATHLKSKATMAMTKAGQHPLAQFRKTAGTVPTPWSEGIWSVFINDETQLNAAIHYVQRHPVKEGLPAQSWDFIVPV